MYKIGRGVLMVEPKGNVSRVGEACLFRLKNGTIMMVYNEFCTADAEDNGEARLIALYSHDEGETWGEKRILMERPEDALNLMNASLIYMNNGDIGLFYLCKYQEDGLVYDDLVLRRSTDEGLTWSESTVCNTRKGYFVKNPGRVIRLSGGRIVIPVADHSPDKAQGKSTPGVVFALYSDDDGVTWQESQKLYQPFGNSPAGLCEPGVYEKENGDLYMYIRTDLGFQFESTSHDKGQTWSAIQPNFVFASPNSPMTLRKFGNKTVGFFNPIQESLYMWNEHDLFRKSNRTPLLAVVSEDDGETYGWGYYLEDDWSNVYSYVDTVEGEDYFLAAYYHSNDTMQQLHSLKVLKVMYSELENRYQDE